MPGKVIIDKIDLRQFYAEVAKTTNPTSIKDLCQQTIINSVGRQEIKDRFLRQLKSTTNTTKMIKYITDYALAGQGLAVIKAS